MSIHRFIHKGVSLQFHGQKMNLSLSMGLFSSNDIDAGSRLLLKSMASELDFSTINTAVDIGCGIGTLGIALKKKAPQCKVLCRDRDSLALDFTEHNCQVNGIKDMLIQRGLFLQDLEPKSFDLLICNVPAKAGKPVIDHFIDQAPLYCLPHGRVAIVVVQPLRQQVETALDSAGHKILFEEHNKMYSVFHFTGAGEIRNPGLSLYFRHEDQYHIYDQSYNLTTVFGLADFDQISWKDQLTGETLRGINRGGHWTLVDPGQGHFACYLLKAFSGSPRKITLISRDLLQLEITAFNLKQGKKNCEIEKLHLSSEEQWMEKLKDVDFLHINIDPIPRTAWEEPLSITINQVLSHNGLYCLTGRSKDVQPLTKNLKKSQIIGDKRFRGWRSVVIKKT